MSSNQHHDPRLGDESMDDSDGDEASSRPQHAAHGSSFQPRVRGRSSTAHRLEKHVRLDTDPDPASEGTDLERGVREPSDQTTTDEARHEKESGKPEHRTSDSESKVHRARLRRMWQTVARLVQGSPFSVDLNWVPSNFTWSKLKPVIRSALLAWVSSLFVIISKTEVLLGQASFLILIAAVLMPPNNPFIAVLEQELTLMIFVAIAWAWSCLGLFLANLSRQTVNPTAPTAEILSGIFIEAAPSVIQCVFLFLGSTFFLFLKARFGPGPFLVPTILACICLDVCLCTAALFPYAFYDIGKAVVIPLAFHSALSIFFAATIFPSTVTAQYTASIGAVLDPISTFLGEHRKILQMDPSSEEFSAAVGVLRGLLNKSEGGMTAAAVWYRLLQRDVIWGRFAPADIGSLQWWVRRIVTRADGMNVYFGLIDPTREKWPQTPAPSTPGTPMRTRQSSPVASSRNSIAQLEQIANERSLPLAQDLHGDRGPSRPPSTIIGRPETIDSVARRRLVGRPESVKRASSPLHTTLTRHVRDIFHRQHSHQHRLRPSDHDDHLHFSLLQLAHTLSFPSLASLDHHLPSSAHEGTVGVFESQRYLALESARLAHVRSPEFTEQFTKLLGEACDELLRESQSGLDNLKEWLAGVRRGKWESKGKEQNRRKERLESLENAKNDLDVVVQSFRKDTRLCVLEPYRAAFDPKHSHGADIIVEAPPHKYLFHCYMYEYHTMQLALLVSGALGEVIDLEKERKRARLWFPTFAATFLFWWTRWNGSSDMDHTDDEDPDIIQYMERDAEGDPDLGETKARDPDALPPSNMFEYIMFLLYKGFASIGGGNSLFAIKAGLLTVALSLPYHFKASASFAYQQHLTWAIFIGQLTIARFRGDTTFGLVARIIATFFGGLLGTVLWYISTGSGRGNAYGLAVTCAITFPVIFFARLYWTAPPVSNMIFFVTAIVILGFSWQDTHFPAGFIYFGINVSWRRFVLVTAGVTTAFLASFLPPTMTLRSYQRRMMSTTVAEIGSVYCSVLSFANTQGTYEVDRGSIVQSLIAIRLKLKRSLVLRANIVYEFSLRGRWPSERYHKILEIQLETAYLLSHLMSVVEHLEPAWRRAFLRRTRFTDADFQGDVLAVISMISTALRTGHPLPQITPCPLLDRYMQNQHGLNVIRHEADDDYGLPRTMTLDTLSNEQYMCFSVGCTTAFGIILRLDRLMLATKELVGEQYHIHGVGLTSYGAFTNGQSTPVRPTRGI
ncbi:hypothetical protein BDW22DRAFT_1355705 [Trametopsis cervina]|nr:hypothetical protein BDW22DRAFT_1355705 [Trametopsis cervina]